MATTTVAFAFVLMAWATAMALTLVAMVVTAVANTFLLSVGDTGSLGSTKNTADFLGS